MATIKEAIDRVDLLQPNDFTDAQKVAWLSELDMSVYWQLMRRHTIHDEYQDPGTDAYMTGDMVTFAGVPYSCLANNTTLSPEEAPASWEAETFSGYTALTDEDTSLLAPVPYDMPLYTHWLLMQMDLYNREIDQYNNRALLYNLAWRDLAKYVTRTYLPLQTVSHFAM